MQRVVSLFRKKMKIIGDGILGEMHNMLARTTQTGDVRDSNADDEDKMAMISEACASIYERVDTTLDAAKVSLASDAGASVVTATAWSQGSHKRVRFMHAKNIKRPQEDFELPVDNSSAPFIPHLKEKPFAKAPLVVEAHKNPYLPEIESWTPSDAQLAFRDITPALPLEGPCAWIDTPEELKRVAEKLSTVSEFAIDLEAHSYRSYQGFTCLMQVSTRAEDFLIDVLALRAHMSLLAAPFANPSIVKVLHGADFDVLWLQRDFGLYIVNMFDTGQAARLLSLPRFSLAYLLSTFCNVTANKAFQLADWRIRPLSAEMLHYAREDTHYLLFIYDKLVNQLLETGNEFKNHLVAVYDRSKELCARTYEKFVYTQAHADELLQRFSRGLNPTQREVFYALHEWRDSIARADDESIRYVLPDHMLLELSEAIPRDHAQILACCQPAPPHVRLHVTSILEIIAAAKSKTPRLSAQPAVEVRHAPNNVYVDADNLDEPMESEINAGALFDAAAWVPRPPTTALLFHSDDEDFDMAAVQRCMRIRSSFAGTPLYGAASVKKETEPFDRKGSAESTDSAGDVPVAATEPSSFAEIYRLSNINRKKNKKKKQREDGAAEDGDSDDGDAGPAAAAADPESFMQSIGWAAPEAPSTGFAKPGTAAAPYDFGAAPSLPASVEARPSFNPHEDSARQSGGQGGRSITHMKQGQRSVAFQKK